MTQQRFGRFGAVLLLLMTLASAAAAEESKTRVVKATGQGINKEEALADAKRRAIEQAGKVYLASQSKTENFVLVYDTVLTKVVGLIKDWKELKTEKGVGGTVAVTIEAAVGKEIFDATWAEVKMLADQIGNPTVMVVFTDVLYDLNTPKGRGKGVVDRSSFVEKEIEGLLAKHGFEVINKEGFADDQKRLLDEAVADDNAQLMQKLATQAKAHLLIKGVGNATGPRVSENQMVGKTLYMWETDVELSAYWTNGARTMFTKTSQEKGGSDVDGRPGGKRALKNTAAPLAEECVREILAGWTQAATGGGKVELIVSGLDYKQHMAIYKGLPELAKVKLDRQEFKSKVGTYIMTAQTSADHLAEALSGLEFVNGSTKVSLDIEGVEMGRIKAKPAGN